MACEKLLERVLMRPNLSFLVKMSCYTARHHKLLIPIVKHGGDSIIRRCCFSADSIKYLISSKTVTATKTTQKWFRDNKGNVLEWQSWSPDRHQQKSCGLTGNFFINYISHERFMGAIKSEFHESHWIQNTYNYLSYAIFVLIKFFDGHLKLVCLLILTRWTHFIPNSQLHHWFSPSLLH